MAHSVCVMPDATRRSRLCRVWCAGVNWTIALNASRLHIFGRRVLSSRESKSHRRSGRDTDKSFVVSGVAV